MGSRSRRDPAGHAARGKGTPTTHADPDPIAAHAPAGPGDQVIEAPAPRMDLFMAQAVARHVPKDQSPLGMALVCVTIGSGDLVVNVYMPAELAEQFGQLVADQVSPPATSGIVMPDGTPATDPATIVAAHQQIKGDTPA